MTDFLNALATLLGCLPSGTSTAVLLVSTVLFTTYLCHKIFVNRTTRLLREAEARWRARQSTTSLLIESIPSGWFNILLTAVWPSLLERFFANLATERLERVFQRRIRNHKHKFPWRHLRHVSVEHVTLGLTPPQFQLILAKYDPTKQTLKLEADVKWSTSAFQIVLCPVIRSPMFPHLKTRFLLSNLDISGHISATLALCPQQPGIKTCEISFSDVPVIDMRITPMGMALKDFPGIPESLRATIVRILTKGMVHPKKLLIDVCKIYNTQRMKRRGGHGGLLAMNLSSATGFFESAIGTVEVFCECSLGKHTFRTPIRSGSQAVVWDWNCGIRLNEKLKDNLDQDLIIKLFNSRSLGEPELLAHGTYSMRDVEIAELRAGLVSKSLGLESEVSSHQPIVHFTLQLIEPQDVASPTHSTPMAPQDVPVEPPHEAAPEMQDETDMVSSAPALLEQIGTSYSHDSHQDRVEAIEAALAQLSERKSTEDPETEPDAAMTSLFQMSSSTDSLPLFSAQNTFFDSAPEVLSTPHSTSVEGETRPTEDMASTNGFTNLLHVTRFDDTLRRDRLVHKQQLVEMRSQVVMLEQQLAAEQNKRLDEGLRALTEGGRFVVHKQHERALRHLWYDPATSSLTWASQKLPVEAVTQMSQIKSQPVHQISEIRTGIEYFPRSTKFGLGALRSYVQRRMGGLIKEEPVPIEENCFSILFVNNKALNLEIPSGGNGRSRNAWVDALQALLKSQIEKPL